MTTAWPSPIARIAVGVDGYPEGNDAAVLGHELACVMRAELTLVAVHAEPLVVLPEEINWLSLDNQAAAMLAEVRETWAPGATLRVERGPSVAGALEHMVSDHHEEMLVLGSSRHAREGSVRIGKRTRQLLAHLQVPLALAPRGMRNSAARGLKQIAVGYDGGCESEAALALAGGIAQAAGAALRVCCAVDDRLPFAGILGAEEVMVERWEERVGAEMDALRDFATSAAERTKVPASVEVLRGRPAAALLKLSTEADMLVVGSRRWGPVARLVLGSTGEALAHEAACPLIVVPRPRTAAAAT